ncbi:UPF0553 protein [Glycine soja]|nr:UPF0553 protein [Glycine soja]
MTTQTLKMTTKTLEMTAKLYIILDRLSALIPTPSPPKPPPTIAPTSAPPPLTLASTIEARGEIGPGTEEEVELRACSVHAVEKMRELISVKSGRQVLSVELDLWLWASGVQSASLQHHRTLSIYY